MPSFSFKYLLLIALCFLLFLPSVSAFGAGEIPDFAYLNDKAFRHLDIENILEYIVRWVGPRPPGGGGSKGGILGAAASILSAASGGGELKFTKADVHRVYFGNWLRDYSQAMDIAGLSKATSETIILLLSVLSFMTFGYATEEFELLGDKLGVYLPVEHIDNPKGYGGDEDPRKYHKKLRPPVNQEELKIDPRTGMKNYIANDGHGWDTSAAHVRRSLEKVIQLVRQSGGHRSPELYEGYRLMGGALHTLEDLLAHSNWIELCLRKMGHQEVFCHVGDGATVNAPGGQRVPPLVTGTFGSADFIFSVMGEAGDKLSESSVSELTKKIANAQGKQETLGTIKNLLSKIPSGGGDDANNEMQEGEKLKQQALNFDPDNYVTEDVQRQLLELLRWRDRIMRRVDSAIEHIPGLEDLVGQMTDALNVFIYTTIEPYVKPILGNASDALGAGSRAVIDKDDQYEVFNNPQADDPSHSMLSKDHFDNILNEPAGKIAKVVVEVAVNKIVACWSDPNGDIRRTIDEILMAFHHPFFADDRCQMHVAMAQAAQKWFNELGRDQQETLNRLTKESVREGKNKRLGADDSVLLHSHAIHPGGGGGGRTGGYGGSSGGGYGGGSTGGSGGYGGSSGGYGGSTGGSGGGYGSSGGGYGSGGRTGGYDDNTSSGGGGYGQHGQHGRQHHQQQQQSSYGRSDNDYGSKNTGGDSYGSSGGYGSRRQDDDSYGGSGGGGYGSSRQDDSYGSTGGGAGYGSRRQDDNDSYGSSGRHQQQHHQSGGYGSEERSSYGQSTGGYGQSTGGYGQSTGTGGYGSRDNDSYGQSGTGGYGRSGRDDNDNEYGSSRRTQESSYGQTQSSYGQSQSSYGREESSGYGRQEQHHGGKHHHQEEESRGSGGGYGRSGGRSGGDEDTFGFERVNISDRDRDTSGGYGSTGGGYGSSTTGGYGGSTGGYGGSTGGYGGSTGGHGGSTGGFGGLTGAYGGSSGGYGSSRQDDSYGSRSGSGGYGGDSGYGGGQSYGGNDDDENEHHKKHHKKKHHNDYDD